MINRIYKYDTFNENNDENIITIDLRCLKEKLDEDGFECLIDDSAYNKMLDVSKIIEFVTQCKI